MNVCLLLAAGSSSRMNNGKGTTCKLLLPYKGTTFFQHAIDEARQLEDIALLVVTGCYHALLKEILIPQQIDFIQNESWQQGMGTSIQKGMIGVLRLFPAAESVIIMVADQPHLSTALLNTLLDTKQQTGKGIVASVYNESTGTPVLFGQQYFQQLALLIGQSGAKKLVQQYSDDVATVPFALGAVDIDTPEDYEHISK